MERKPREVRGRCPKHLGNFRFGCPFQQRSGLWGSGERSGPQGRGRTAYSRLLAALSPERPGPQLAPHNPEAGVEDTVMSVINDLVTGKRSPQAWSMIFRQSCPHRPAQGPLCSVGALRSGTAPGGASVAPICPQEHLFSLANPSNGEGAD